MFHFLTNKTNTPNSMTSHARSSTLFILSHGIDNAIIKDKDRAARARNSCQGIGTTTRYCQRGNTMNSQGMRRDSWEIIDKFSESPMNLSMTTVVCPTKEYTERVSFYVYTPLHSFITIVKISLPFDSQETTTGQIIQEEKINSTQWWWDDIIDRERVRLTCMIKRSKECTCLRD